jgi:hydroxyacylglutathione hydrolase
MNRTVLPIRTLRNNYAWLATADGHRALVVDPGEAGPVRQALEERGNKLELILLTHLHPDHCGGTNELKKLFPQAQVVMHPADAGRVDFTVDRKVVEGESITFDTSEITLMHLPCHTQGCVAYQLDDYLFTGDTLFTAGCGKFFEGTADAMHKNLARLKKLPPATKICCGHEYTVENLIYAHRAEPGNQALTERLKQARRDEADGKFLVPATLELELATNPFLRLDDPGLQKNLSTKDEFATLTALYEIYYQQKPPV